MHNSLPSATASTTYHRLQGSQAYAKALAKAGILTDEEASTLVEGLDRVAAEWAAGTFEVKQGDEDIHTANERRLSELVRPHKGCMFFCRVCTLCSSCIMRYAASCVMLLPMRAVSFCCCAPQMPASSMRFTSRWGRSGASCTQGVVETTKWPPTHVCGCTVSYWRSAACCRSSSVWPLLVPKRKWTSSCQVTPDVHFLAHVPTHVLLLRHMQHTLTKTGFTHLQPAQTVRWSHWLMSHVAAWQRDDMRLRDLLPRVATLPLGSGALAGNPFCVDRRFLAAELGMVRCRANVAPGGVVGTRCAVQGDAALGPCAPYS